jgi:hypothetical protein
MPVGSQNAESPKYASAPGEKEGGDADTLLGETLVYANKVEQHQQQTQCEGTLVYTEGDTEGTLVYDSEQQQRPQHQKMTLGAERGEPGMEVESQGDGDELGLVEDFV